MTALAAHPKGSPQATRTNHCAHTEAVCVACKDDRCYSDFYSAAFCVPLLCLALHSLGCMGWSVVLLPKLLAAVETRCGDDPGSLSNPQ